MRTNAEGSKDMEMKARARENITLYREYSWFQRITRKSYQSVVNVSSLRKILSLAVAIIIWHLFSEYKIFPLARVPSPYEVLLETSRYVFTKQFWLCAVFSSGRVFVGMFAGCVIGIPLGILIGWKRHFKNVVFPVFELMRPVPLLAWLPLSVLMFPLTELSIVFLLFLASGAPVVINTILGVENIPTTCINAALSLGSKPRDILIRVILPGALPSICTGVAIGIGFEWEATVAAEMLSGGFGLGYMTWEAFILNIYPRVIMGMFAIGAAGYFFTGIVRAIGMQLTPWRKLF